MDLTTGLPPAAGRIGATRSATRALALARTAWQDVPWSTVLPYTVVISVANGFWITSLQGAVGAVERAQSPFSSWMHLSLLISPLVLAAVLTAVAFTRRRYGPTAPGVKAVLLGVLLVAIAGSAVGVGAVAVNAASNYHLQSEQLHRAHAQHSTAVSGENIGSPPTVASDHPHGSGSATCRGTCLLQRQTLQLHVRSFELVAPLLTGTNLVLVAWLTAARGGRLVVSTRRRRTEGTV